MPLIEPVDRETAERQGLGTVLDAWAEMGDEDGVFPRILARATNYAAAIGDAMVKSHLEGGLDHRLKEIIRIQLARMAQDPYFASLRSRRAIAAGLSEEEIDAGSTVDNGDPRFTPAEQWALRYAFLMYRHPDQVDQKFYDQGKQHYSEAQIMELGGMIAVHYGMQVFMRTLQAGPVSSRSP